ncbi:hypothetical protein MOQ26_08190 [Stenotrophomonas maltophilia]|nr:hypothetical protein [Stenotrophomonas maltophilia]
MNGLSLLLIRAVLAVVVLAACVAPAVAQEVVEYIHTDALGSPVAITDAGGNVIERTVYEPYGAVVNRPLKDGPGYTGHVTDSGTGLSYMQQRYMDPQLGRFLSADPVTAYQQPVSNFNSYVYALNNPYKFTDPDGRDVTCNQSSCTIESRSLGEAIVDYGTVGIIYARRLLENAIAESQKNESQGPTPEPGTTNSDEGCIYCVSGENTSSGKDYIGSTDDLDSRARDRSDGRDRRGAEKVDSYKKGDRTDRQNKEQKAMNDRGGKDGLDNKRNEVAPKRWQERGIDPPTAK